MKSRRFWWLMFVACTAALAGVMVWVTVLVIRLERAESAARGEIQHEQLVRLALWRMDSWLAPHLAREAARPYFEYLPFYAQQRLYTRMLNEIEPGEVVTPSPLLQFRSEFFPLHFQISADDELTSPQVPAGNMRDLAEARYLAPGEVEIKAALLEDLRAALQPRQLDTCVANAESAAATIIAGLLEPVSPSIPEPQADQAEDWQKQQYEASKEDLTRRAQSSTMAQTASSPQQLMTKGGLVADDEPIVEIGPFVPLWLCGTVVNDSPRLMFIRRVNLPEGSCFQGVLGDWPELRGALMAQIQDLFPQGSLVPLSDPAVAADQPGRVLATIPAALQVPSPVLSAGSWITPARTTLGITWLAVAAALLAAALTLRASIAFGERRSRFASAVTHELRTPLTTFRMYSEMLAENMVRDPAQRQVYLDTLRTESNRLSTLVENVLAYARVEEGRAPSRVEATTLRELLDRVTPDLQARAEASGMELGVYSSVPAKTMLRVDVSALSQILFNLVDNACKYACHGKERSIQLGFEVGRRHLQIYVIDHGPGIAPEHARIIFAPFERGAHGPGDTIPGVGLGLALCRGLAREMGGELTLERDRACGACFLLSLPTGPKAEA